MTIRQAIAQLDDVKPNVYDVPQKVRWLQTLDERVKHSVIDTHEGGEDVPTPNYTTSDLGVELLIDAAYDDIYIHWLKAMIDLNNNEYELYNNEIEIYNAAFVEYSNWYNRTHKPLSQNFSFF